MGITGIAAAIGIGSAIAGTAVQIDAASAQNAAQQQQIQISQQENTQRQHLFEIEQQRKRVENLRNAQQATSTARARAVNQGAQFGSGLLGGVGQVQGESNYNILGISQNTQIGENMFALDQQMTQAKIASANAATESSIGGALTSFGGSVINSLGTIGNLSSGFGGKGLDVFNMANVNYAGRG
jgi:hypothetical protein